MRRFITALTAVALSLSLSIGLLPSPAAAATDFDSAYQFESAFLSLKPGDSGSFSVFFANTGTTSWVTGSSSQVNLATCLDNKSTCGVAPEEAAFASAWLSTVAYATHTKATVVPGDFSAFSYNIVVPSSQAAGTYRFNGELVVAATGVALHPEGYYQDATVTIPAPVGYTVSPAFAVANDKVNFASSAMPGVGQHTISFNAPALVGQTLSFVIIEGANASLLSDGSYSFCDRNQDSKADLLTDGTVLFTAVNGVATSQASTLLNQVIPAGGTITVTVDSATRNKRVRVVGWQDKSANGQLDLTVAGADTRCDTFTPYNVSLDGQIATSGRKFWTGPLGTFGAQFPDGSGNAQCEPTYAFSAAGLMFTSGPTSATSLRYNLDTNDTYKIIGTPVSQSQFLTSLNANADGTGDTIKVNYNPDVSGTSEFSICTKSGSAAPSNLGQATGNFDAGSTANDVRVTFTAPTNNTTTTYPIQRSFLGASTTATTSNCALGATAPSSTVSSTPGDTTFTTVGSATASAGQTGTFTNFDLADGGYCYRIRTQDPTTGAYSHSNYVVVNIPGTTDGTAPTSTTAVITTSAGLGGTLDTGDKLYFVFSEAMSVGSGAIIRFTDSDCGAATQAGPATCSGGTSNTVGDAICGTNATCSLDTATSKLLVVTMTANPTIVAAGSTTGLGYSLVVTDSSGITDSSGNGWNFGSQAGGDDRLITNP